MDSKLQRKILNIVLIFVLLQPILDILSRLAILDIIPNISTYLKPFFVFGLCTYLLFCYSPIKKKWLTYIGLFIFLTIGHLYLLYKLLLGTSLILHEFRFMINIAYMIALFISLFTLYYHTSDSEKELVFRKIKNTLFYTFMLYFSLYLVAVLTGTSGMTYEYADKYKLGYKGWYDSGQILGHAFSILFPIVLYGILKPKNHKIIRIIFMILALIVVSLLGTKVPYFITVIVLILYLIIVLFIKFFNKEFERNWFNVVLVTLSIVVLFSTYKYTPVAYNTDINNKNALIELEKYDINSISGKKNKNSYKKLIKKHKGSNVDDLVKYYDWSQETSNYLEQLFYAKKLHPSNTRGKQFFYSYKMFKLADLKYKIFGIGYLVQEEEALAIESDFFMALFDFGVLGFVLFLLIPIKEFFKSLIFILRNLNKIDLETYMLFMGLGIFFCISCYAGYTYIYTNFSIFLVLLILMLKLKIDILNSSKKKVKSISFLSLHLGYGGIESATINSANVLSKKYDVEIISFYKLKKNQEKNINCNVKIKYLYSGEPNREKFLSSKNERKYIKMLLEGFRSLKILLYKKILLIITIRRCNSDAIVSTRVEFNVLLSKYGKRETLKIAQEHCYHNNNKKYINKIKNCYYNIDYLCALTTTLKCDYEKFLVKNSHTKVVLLPNMLTNLPIKKSKLNNNIITVSRLDYGKRNDEIIKAFSKIKDKNSKLFIIGDGKEYNNLKNIISDLNLDSRVFLLGYLSHEKIEKYMLDSSIFLMASITEGLPMVLLEAMSYGVPCIAYETASGTRDIIENEYNGYLVKNRDENEYIKDIDLILSDKKLREKYSKNAILTSKKYYKDNVLKIWKDIFRDYIGE